MIEEIRSLEFALIRNASAVKGGDRGAKGGLGYRGGETYIYEADAEWWKVAAACCCQKKETLV